MIGLINAYYFNEHEEYQKRYSSLYQNFAQSVYKNKKIKMYHVAFGEWPSSPEECQTWIISGSSKGSYESEDWILQLSEFIQNCEAKKAKLIGICFGHQLIAHSLGGKTEKHPHGWGVGVKEFNIIQTKSWMTPSKKSCSLLFSHQDQVVQLPPQAEHLAQSDFCKYQMFSIKEHIFTMQGHPEFSQQFAQERMESRKKILGEETYKSGMKSVNQKTDSDIIGNWMRNFSGE